MLLFKPVSLLLLQPVVVLLIISLSVVPLLLPSCSAALTLITLDVDGTLVQGSGSQADASAHARAFAHACGTVLGKNNNGQQQRIKPVAQALARHEFHGSTDGLILLRLARAELGVEEVSEETLEKMFDSMYEYIAALDDREVAKGIQTLPGVMDQLQKLASLQKKRMSSWSSPVACGLVTGNVEGIARRKMLAVGILGTGALAPPSEEQLIRNKWPGSEDIGFLGGFGSDYCSRNIKDSSRNYLDRGEQIAIAAPRCRSIMSSSSSSGESLSRVVHVGDAPADVLAAKAYSETVRVLTDQDQELCVGMVAVATGSYTADQLREAAGKPIPGRWEPVILEKGMADPYFLDACGF